MPRPVILGAVILYLMSLSYPSSAMAFTVADQPIQKGAHPQAATKLSSHAGPNISKPSVQAEVANIFVDKIDGGAIYAKDGRKFEITGVKVIDNSHRVTKMRTAELVFVDGRLVAVTLK